MNKGFLSVYALLILTLTTCVIAYISLVITSQNKLDGTKLYEDVLVLKEIQHYYQNNCIVEEDNVEESTEKETEMNTYQFSTNSFSYELTSSNILLKDNVEYLQFNYNIDLCIYDSYFYLQK